LAGPAVLSFLKNPSWHSAFSGEPLRAKGLMRPILRHIHSGRDGKDYLCFNHTAYTKKTFKGHPINRHFCSCRFQASPH